MTDELIGPLRPATPKPPLPRRDNETPQDPRALIQQLHINRAAPYTGDPDGNSGRAQVAAGQTGDPLDGIIAEFSSDPDPLSHDGTPRSHLGYGPESGPHYFDFQHDDGAPNAFGGFSLAKGRVDFSHFKFKDLFEVDRSITAEKLEELWQAQNVSPRNLAAGLEYGIACLKAPPAILAVHQAAHPPKSFDYAFCNHELGHRNESTGFPSKIELINKPLDPGIILREIPTKTLLKFNKGPFAAGYRGVERHSGYHPETVVDSSITTARLDELLTAARSSKLGDGRTAEYFTALRSAPPLVFVEHCINNATEPILDDFSRAEDAIRNFSFSGRTIGSRPIARYGPEQQRIGFFDKLTDSSFVGPFLLTEPTDITSDTEPWEELPKRTLLQRLQTSEPPSPDELARMLKAAIAKAQSEPEVKLDDTQVSRLLAVLHEPTEPATPETSPLVPPKILAKYSALLTEHLVGLLDKAGFSLARDGNRPSIDQFEAILEQALNKVEIAAEQEDGITGVDALNLRNAVTW